MKKETAHGRIPEGGQGVRTPPPPPPEKSPEIGFLSILVITKLPKPSAKRHLNGISLAGQRWPTYSGVWILSHIINQNLKKRYQSWTPPTKLSGSAHAAGQLCFKCEVRFRASRPPHSTQLLKQQQHLAS